MYDWQMNNSMQTHWPVSFVAFHTAVSSMPHSSRKANGHDIITVEMSGNNIDITAVNQWSSAFLVRSRNINRLKKVYCYVCRCCIFVYEQTNWKTGCLLSFRLSFLRLLCPPNISILCLEYKKVDITEVLLLMDLELQCLKFTGILSTLFLIRILVSCFFCS